MILETICRGNYAPGDFIYPTDPDYRNANQKICDLIDILKSQLSAPHYQLVEELAAQIYTAQCVECESYFKLGFATGMAIEREVHEELQQTIQTH